MKTNTTDRIIGYIATNKQTRPHELVKSLHLSQVAVHKQLKKLLALGIIQKVGKPPLVFYTQVPKQPASTLTLEQIKQKAIPILKKAGVNRSSLFGSYVHGEQRDNSDVDILVDLPDGKSLYDLIDLENRLKDVLHKDVDVITYNSVSPYVEKYIFANQIQLL